MKTDGKALWNVEMGRVVSPLAIPTMLHEEREALKSLSPTESRTTCSSYSSTEQQVAHTTTTRRQPKKLSPSRIMIQPSITSRRSSPKQTRVHNPPPPKPHVFVSPSPEETSDPEEQKRRKEARAREQQQLILERVQAVREEKQARRKTSYSAPKPTMILQKNKAYRDESTRAPTHESLDGFYATKDTKNIKQCRGGRHRGRRKTNRGMNKGAKIRYQSLEPQGTK
eukprot:scaffold227_cov165-Amphora_coffeaeformis.AAC.43